MGSKRKKRQRSTNGESAPKRSSASTPWKRILSIASIAILAIAGFFFLSRNRPVAAPAPLPLVPVEASSTLVRDEKQVFPDYAGSTSCAECHQEIYAKWKGSNHGQAERLLTATDDKAFTPARTFQHGTQHTDLRETGGKPEVVALGPEKKYEAFPVARVIGNDPIQQFLVALPGGRLQTLEATYDPHRNEWFNVYGNEDRQPGEWGHWTGRGMNWNNMCAACHNTRVHKNYDEGSDRYATTMAEPTVSCESCHGTMKTHVDWRRTHGNAKLADPTIRKFTPDQVFETCAQCHSRRMELTDAFAPGKSFYDHHALTTVDETDTLYPDGQVRDEDYEYSAFLGSKMHAAGVRCADCHDPHTAKVRLPGNLMCMSCHSGGYKNAPVIDPSAHSFHKVDPLYSPADPAALAKRPPDAVAASGGECINCHMPQTYYMQRHRRHDHGFTIPDPLLTKELGIPNACNRCHFDKDAGWALEWTNKWYGAKMERPSRARTRTIAAAREGKTEGRDGLLAMLSGTDAPYWKASAAKLLERWAGEPLVTTALLEATKSASPLVRSNAVRSLDPLANDRSVGPVLHDLLNDPVRSVRFPAEWALRATLDPQSSAGSELLQTLDYLADQPTGQMQKGAYFLSRNDPQQALVHYRKAVEWDPGSAPFRHDLAVVLSNMNHGAEAVTQLEAACKLEPNNAEYRYMLALAWNEVGQTDKTVEALRAAVQLDPGHARAWYNLGLVLNARGNTPESLTALHRAAEANPTDPRIPYASATILARIGSIEEARQAARRALEIDPNFRAAQEFIRLSEQR